MYSVISYTYIYISVYIYIYIYVAGLCWLKPRVKVNRKKKCLLFASYRSVGTWQRPIWVVLGFSSVAVLFSFPACVAYRYQSARRPEMTVTQIHNMTIGRLHHVLVMRSNAYLLTFTHSSDWLPNTPATA